MNTINISFYFFLTIPCQALPITSQNLKSKNLRVVYQIVMQEVQRKFYYNFGSQMCFYYWSIGFYL